MISMLLLVMSAEPAAAEAPWALRWNAPESCRQRAEVQQSVEERLHREVFGGDGPRFVIDGRVEKTDSGWKARVTLADATGALLGTREVKTAEGECTALDAKVSLVLALMIDPSAALRTDNVKQAAAPRLPVQAVAPQAEFPLEARVSLSFDGDAPMRLRRVAFEGSSGASHLTGVAEVCSAPCAALVPAGAELWIVGDGVPSSAFRVPTARSVNVFAHAGSTGLLTLGVLLETFGLTSLTLGAVGVAVSAGHVGNDQLIGLSAGGMALGTGLIIGGVFALINGRTEVTVTPTAP